MIRILPVEKERRNMIILNVFYDWSKYGKGNDILTIIYKDLDTGEKLIHEQTSPEIEIYVAKPDEQDKYEHMRDYIPKDTCNRYVVSYRNRWYEAAKILKLKSIDDAKKSPYLFNIDVDLEHYIIKQFQEQYPTEKPIELDLGFFDIESDIINVPIGTFASYGQTPIWAITYINLDKLDVYTLVLCKDSLNLDSYAPTSSIYKERAELKESLETAIYKIFGSENGISDLKQKLHDTFYEEYGEMNYNIIPYDDEMTMLKDFIQIIQSCDNDYVSAWNVPYDIGSIVERIKVLGGSPEEIIPDKRFKNKRVVFREDHNPMVQRRRHQIILSTIPTFIDDMVIHTGIRAVGSRLPSHKLAAVARNEIASDKIDFSETTDIRHLYYKDLEKGIIYNIGDTLLLVGLHRKNRNTEVLYSRINTMGVKDNEIFTTTKAVWNAFTKFIYNREAGKYVTGINRNRGNKNIKMIDYGKLVHNAVNSYSSELLDDYETTEDDGYEANDFYNNNLFELEIEDDSDDESRDSGKRKKYDGALVSSPLHMLPTGVTIMGKNSDRVHDNVGLMDVMSEYPTATSVWNMSNETLVGKVYLEDEDSVVIDIPEMFVFKGDDKAKYKLNKSNRIGESIVENDALSFGTIFLDLPTMDEILDITKKELGAK